MTHSQNHNASPNIAYRQRILGAIVVAELIFIAVFNLWPTDETKNKKEPVSYNEDVVMMEEAVITEQASSPPAPPKPQIPVPVPNDEIIRDKVITFDNIDPSDFSDTLSTSKRGAMGRSDDIASSPQQPPSVIRIVEANTPDAAQKADIKAELTVSFLVGTDGRVEDVSIATIKVYEEDSNRPKLVDSIGYGIMEATISAAQQWKFRPAQKNGKPVRAYSKQIFTFGF
ncbi:protein TonB, links inner and outer membranes [Fodinibius salinus]|uniref:Protein TonB, links inner and outer membranes n=1 Tax=Fodinibius salinus TaxID=860790 RepID=A0A5D3YNQ9_9BACT|nr:energy transducer TonB [Fodinibius salinus]TYP95437.1 protein TonB, links inner and outer membranes [Fodinibius salinus]